MFTLRAEQRTNEWSVHATERQNTNRRRVHNFQSFHECRLSMSDRSKSSYSDSTCAIICCFPALYRCGKTLASINHISSSPIAVRSISSLSISSVVQSRTTYNSSISSKLEQQQSQRNRRPRMSRRRWRCYVYYPYFSRCRGKTKTTNYEQPCKKQMETERWRETCRRKQQRKIQATRRERSIESDRRRQSEGKRELNLGAHAPMMIIIIGNDSAHFHYQSQKIVARAWSAAAPWSLSPPCV